MTPQERAVLDDMLLEIRSGHSDDVPISGLAELAQNLLDSEQFKIGLAIQAAVQDLPTGWSLRITILDREVCVELDDVRITRTCTDDVESEHLAEVIARAVQHAKESEVDDGE